MPNDPKFSFRPASFSFVALLAWSAGLVYLLWPSFRWQIEYFKAPGPVAYYGILIVAPLLAISSLVYSRLRGSRSMPWEPIVIFAPLLVLVLRQPWGSACALLLLASSLALGRLVLARLGLVNRNPGEWALPLLTGVSVWAWLLSMAGLAGFLFRPLLWTAAALPAIWAMRVAPQAWRSLRALPLAWASDPEVQRPLTGVLVPFLALALLSGVFVAAAPPVINDAVMFQLPLVQKWVQTGSLTPSFDHPYSFYPQSFEALMAWAYSIGGAPAAQAFCFALSLVALAVCWQIVRMLGGSRQTAAATAAMIASAPFFSWTASVLKNDWLMAGLQVGSAVCFLHWRADRNVRWVLLGCWFLGCSFGVKHSALFAAAGLGLLVLEALWRLRNRAAVLAAVVLILASTASIWHVRTYRLTGDPGYPASVNLAAQAVNRPTATARYPFVRIARVIRAVHGHSLDVIFESNIPAPAGILFAVLFPLAFFGPSDRWSGNRRTIALVAAVALGYWVMTAANLRYAITPLLLLACLLAAALSRTYASSSHAMQHLLSGVVVYGLLFGWTGSLIIENSVPQIRYVMGLMSADAYIATVHPSLPAIRWLSQRAGPEDRIFAAGCCNPFYYPVGWKVDCTYGGGGEGRIRRTRQLLAPTPYRYYVEPTGAETPRLAPNELVYEDRVCTIRRFSQQEAGEQPVPDR